MATLQAVIDVIDRSSATFARMEASARKFEGALDRIDRRLDEVDRKLLRVGSRDVSPRVGMNTSEFDAEYLRVSSQLAALDMASVAPGLGGGGVGGGGGGLAGAVSGADEGDDGPSGRLGGFRNRLRGMFSGIDFDLNLHKMNNSFHSFFAGFINIFKIGYRVVNTLTTAFIRTIFSTLASGMIKLGALVAQLGGVFARLGGFLGRMGGVLGATGGALAPVIANIGSLGVVAAAATAIVGGLNAALVVLVSILGSLLVPLAGLMPTIAAFIGIIGFAIVPIVMFFREIHKLKQEQEEMVEALKTLTPGTAEFAAKLQELADVNAKLNQNPGFAVYSGFVETFKELKDVVFAPQNAALFVEIAENGLRIFRDWLPVIGELVGAFSMVTRTLVRDLRTFLQSEEGQDSVSGFLKWLPQIAGFASRAIGGLVLMMMRISEAVSPTVVEIFKDLAEWTKGWTDEWSKPGGIQGMRDWFETMYPVFKKVVEVVAAFAGGLVNMAERAAPMAMDFMNWLLDVGPGIADWMGDMAEQWGPVFVEFISTLGGILGLVFRIVGALADEFKPVFLTIFGDDGILDNSIAIIETVWGWLEKTGIIDNMATSFEWLAKGVDLVVEGLKWIVDNIERLQDIGGWLQDNFGWLPGVPNGPAPEGSVTGIPQFGPNGEVTGDVTFQPPDNPAESVARPTVSGEYGLAAAALGIQPPAAASGGGQQGNQRGGVHIGQLTVQGMNKSLEEIIEEAERMARTTPSEPAAGASGP